MDLIEKIKRNNTFQVFDENSGKFFLYKDLIDFTIDSNFKALVFCYLDNSFESVSFLLKALESKNVLVLLSAYLANNLKASLENNYSPNYIFDISRTKISDYKQIDKSIFLRKDNREHNLSPELKVLLSTSGTTGSPKFVKLSEKNILSNAESIGSYLPILQTDCVPLNLPLHYSYGLSILTSNAIIGATVHSGSLDFLSKQFWINFKKYQYSSFAGVPYVYEMLDRIGFTKMDLPSLRYFTQAGGKLRDDLISKYGTYAKQNGKLFYVMYGQTEATARMSYLPPDDLMNNIGSIGKAINNGKFKLDKDTSELIYQGPNIFGGYANCLDDLSYFKQIEELKTGDLARVDEMGFYYITGRRKRIVKVFGNRINLDELESLVSKYFNELYYCVGWMDKMILIFSTNQSCKSNEIVNWLSQEYKLHRSIFKVEIIDFLPLTANGKTDYNTLISNYEGR